MGLALDADEREMRVLTERCYKLLGRDQRSYTGEIFVKGNRNLRALGIGFEMLKEVRRGKKSARKGAVLGAR